ncbi:MAG: hypothetical protein U0792_08740 [Gemmataceae bacterium]
MPNLVRIAGLFALLLLAHTGASAATPKEIEAAKKADWLRAKYSKGVPNWGGDPKGSGPLCMSGLALLEAGVPGDDAAVKAVTDAIRKSTTLQSQTYQVSLSLMYLDRYGEPSDIPLIQVLAARLLAGQRPSGAWGYASSTLQFTQEEETAFKALKGARRCEVSP